MSTWDALPPDLLARIIARVGERPEHALRICRATAQLQNDTNALLEWLLCTFGQSGAIFTLTSVRCVARWPEDRVCNAVIQLFSRSCTVSDETQAGCVLYWATKLGMARVLDVLLSHVTATGWLNSLLKSASAQGHEGCVRVLVSKGADPNVDGGRPLKAATEAGCVGCARALLDAGADLHAAGECALRLCAAAGSPAHVQIMALLLERGADVHAKADEALSLAVERSNAEAVALLLQYGANASARQVLETAASTGSARVVRLLLAHGAPPDADGGRPLRAAAEAGSVEVVRQLLDAGALRGPPGAGGGARRSLGQRPPTGSKCARAGAAAPGGQNMSLARPSLDVGRSAAAAASHSRSDSFRPSSWHGSGAGAAAMQRHRSVARDAAAASSGSHAVSVGPQQQGMPSNGSFESLDMADVVFSESDVGTSDALCKLGSDKEGMVCEGEDLEQPEAEGEEGRLEEVRGCEAGSQALCAALCAGEAEVVRVLLERGARVDVAAVRCWRQWHRYPGVIGVLQKHRPLGEQPSCLLPPSPSPSCTQLDSRQPQQQQQAPPQSASAGTSQPSAAPHWTDQLLTQPRLQAAAQPQWPAGTSQAPGTSSSAVSDRSRRGSHGHDSWFKDHSTPALQLHLREALVAAAAEGSEAAVRLFLTWGAPVAAASELLAAIRGDAGRPAGSSSSTASGSGETGSPLGAFTSDCLSSALTAAASSNRPVILRQLLEHKPDTNWTQAVLHPAALHAAVSEGFLETTRLLLAAGLASLTLAASAPTHNTGSVLPAGLTAAEQENTTGVSGQLRPRHGSSPGLLSLVTSSYPSVTNTPDSTVHGGAGAGAAGAGGSLFSPPPPPLSDQAWGTVVLCAAAACKAGRKPAETLTGLLLQHGFGSCARDALRLVACGRVSTWREEAANVVLSAAFTST